MKRVRSGTAGYTIVESMIFLTITGMMLVSVILLIGGQQKKTEFAAAVRDLDSKIQSVMGNVSSGYYNNTGQTRCEVTGGIITTLTASGGNQGTNSNCVFVGQAIAFPVVGGTDVNIYSIAGLRQTGGKEVSTLLEARPKPFDETKEIYKLANGATLKKVTFGASPVTASTIAFMTSFASSTSNELLSGSAQTNIFALNNRDAAGLETELNNTIAANRTNPSVMRICITNDDQDGLITIVGASTKIEIGRSLPEC